MIVQILNYLLCRRHDTHRSGAASACLWKSSSSSAAVMRPDAGLCLIDAVLGATGVPDIGVPPRIRRDWTVKKFNIPISDKYHQAGIFVRRLLSYYNSLLLPPCSCTDSADDDLPATLKGSQLSSFSPPFSENCIDFVLVQLNNVN